MLPFVLAAKRRSFGHLSCMVSNTRAPVRDWFHYDINRCSIPNDTILVPKSWPVSRIWSPLETCALKRKSIEFQYSLYNRSYFILLIYRIFSVPQSASIMQSFVNLQSLYGTEQSPTLENCSDACSECQYGFLKCSSSKFSFCKPQECIYGYAAGRVFQSYMQNHPQERFRRSNSCSFTMYYGITPKLGETP